MYKERESVIAKLSVGLQVIFTIACFLAVWFFTKKNTGNHNDNMNEIKNSIIIITLLWFIILDQYGLGRIFRLSRYLTIIKVYIKAVVTGIVLLIALNIILKYQSLSLDRLVYFGLLNVIVLSSYKNVVYAIRRFLRRKGYNRRQILVIADKDAVEYIETIIHTKDWGYQIWAIMTDSRLIKEKYADEYMIIPLTNNLKSMLDKNPIDEVIYCRSLFNQAEIQQFISDCSEIGIGFHHQPNFVDVKKLKPHLSLFSHLPFISYQNSPDNYLALKVKAAFDFLFSLFALIVTFPVLAIIAIAIKLDDGGPVFFKQERVGLNGRHFYCFKFRTMVVNAEALKAQLMGQNEQEGPVFKITMDPRVTRIGRFLRKTSLDELPQFINVIRGDMSVVGPRPPLPSEVEKYERWQIRRLSMKPGITCIWQVSGRNNIPFREWMKLDMEYIDNWSLKLDLILILKTIKVMLTGDGK